MAKRRYYSTNSSIYWCLCFLVCVGIILAEESYENTNYDISPLHHRSEHTIHIELLNDKNSHSSHKRDVDNSQIAISTTPVPSSTDNSIVQKDTIHKKKLQTPITKKDTLFHKEIPLLGVNGTGQRRTVTDTKINPVDLPTSVNTPVKATDVDNDSNSPDIVDELTPETVGVVEDIDPKELQTHNITAVKYDTHVFYNSEMYNSPEKFKSLWVNMTNIPGVIVSDELSNSHRKAKPTKLSFKFPFYGHYIENVTVATGGFLYTGNYIHPWIAATQFIAPLMANFDSKISKDSFVRHVDTGKSFTVEWDKINLQESPKNEFTFQTTLFDNGDIVFAYKDIPIGVKQINETSHPVKVGISDAYILDNNSFYVKKKTIYEYHKVSFNKEEIKNGTTIYLKALPTCMDLLNCSSCTSKTFRFNCTWCPAVHRCSVGQDRHKQMWDGRGCYIHNVTDESSCPSNYDYQDDSINYQVSGYEDNDFVGTIPKKSKVGAAGYMALLFLIITISGFVLWVVYAYRNPHSTSGQMLIRYRPSQWRWRRGQARYTAATIHM